MIHGCVCVNVLLGLNVHVIKKFHLQCLGQFLILDISKKYLVCLPEAKECLCDTWLVYLCECECVSALKCACDQMFHLLYLGQFLSQYTYWTFVKTYLVCLSEARNAWVIHGMCIGVKMNMWMGLNVHVIKMFHLLYVKVSFFSQYTYWTLVKTYLVCLSEAKECLCDTWHVYLCENEYVSGLKCACDQNVSPTIFRSVSQSVYILEMS